MKQKSSLIPTGYKTSTYRKWVSTGKAKSENKNSSLHHCDHNSDGVSISVLSVYTSQSSWSMIFIHLSEKHDNWHIILLFASYSPLNTPSPFLALFVLLVLWNSWQDLFSWQRNEPWVNKIITLLHICQCRYIHRTFLSLNPLNRKKITLENK